MVKEEIGYGYEYGYEANMLMNMMTTEEEVEISDDLLQELVKQLGKQGEKINQLTESIFNLTQTIASKSLSAKLQKAAYQVKTGAEFVGTKALEGAQAVKGQLEIGAGVVSNFAGTVKKEVSKAAQKAWESKLLYGKENDPGLLKPAIKAVASFFSTIGKWFKKKAQDVSKAVGEAFNSVAKNCQEFAGRVRKAAPHILEMAGHEMKATGLGMKAKLQQAAGKIGEKLVKAGSKLAETKSKRETQLSRFTHARKQAGRAFKGEKTEAFKEKRKAYGARKLREIKK